MQKAMKRLTDREMVARLRRISSDSLVWKEAKAECDACIHELGRRVAESAQESTAKTIVSHNHDKALRVAAGQYYVSIAKPKAEQDKAFKAMGDVLYNMRCSMSMRVKDAVCYIFGHRGEGRLRWQVGTLNTFDEMCERCYGKIPGTERQGNE